MKRNLLIVDTICQSLGPSLYRASTVDQFNQFLAWLARVCTFHLVHCRVQSKDSLIEAELSKTIGISKQARHINGWPVQSAIYKLLLLAKKTCFVECSYNYEDKRFLLNTSSVLNAPPLGLLRCKTKKVAPSIYYTVDCLWYRQLMPCGHPAITETPIIQTGAKFQAKMNYRWLFDWNTWELLILWTLTNKDNYFRSLQRPQ